MLDWLVNKFAPKIVMEIYPDRLTVVARGTTFTIPTVLYFREKNNQKELLSIGEAPANVPNAKHLFIFEEKDSFDDQKMEGLTLLFWLALKRSQKLNRLALLNPAVTIRGLKNIERFLPGPSHKMIAGAFVKTKAFAKFNLEE